jgi:hypothetical protein
VSDFDMAVYKPGLVCQLLNVYHCPFYIDLEKKMKLSPKKQQGMTMISMLAVAIVVISMFLLVLNILPIYMENGKVTSAMESIKKNPDVKGESPEQISVRLFKILNVDGVNRLTKENVSIGREDDGKIKMRVQYEVVKKLVGNASILVEFNDAVEIN